MTLNLSTALIHAVAIHVPLWLIAATGPNFLTLCFLTPTNLPYAGTFTKSNWPSKLEGQLLLEKVPVKNPGKRFVLEVPIRTVSQDFSKAPFETLPISVPYVFASRTFSFKTLTSALFKSIALIILSNTVRDYNIIG